MSTMTIPGPIDRDSWGFLENSDRRFRQILVYVGTAALVALFVSRWLPVPEPVPEKKEMVRHYIEILPAEKPQVKPLPAPKAEQTEPVKPKPVKPKPQAKKVVTKQQPKAAPKPDTESARQQAEKAGIMALRQQLSSLRTADAPAADTELRQMRQPVAAKETDTASVIASARTASNGSGNLGARNASSTQSGTQIAANETRTVEYQAAAVGTATSKGQTQSSPIGRSLEEIQLAFDRSKGAFYSIFNRVARTDSHIRNGNVVISLTISPDGRVTDCKVVSSSFNNGDLERKLLQRVKMLKFEAKDVPTFTYSNYPISYVPT